MRLSLKIFAPAALAALLIIFSCGPAAARAPVVTARSAILMDSTTGLILYEKKAYVQKEPASLTKIMTAILALEYGHPEETATISKSCARISVGQQMNLVQGDRITLENLIKAALMYSANDSTVAIAQHIAGSEERFIEMMNAKALVLGALNTRFANTNGYHHPNHYSTAYDLALITRYALNNPTFLTIVGTPKDTVRWADGGREMEINNTNKLVRDQSYEGIIGVKTGSTIRAGDCLIAAARRENRTLISVVLHSNNRYRDAVKLLDYGFSGIVPAALCEKSKVFASLPVEGGIRDHAKVISKEAVEVYLDRDDVDKVERKVSLANSLQAPVRAGQEAGVVVFTLRGAELARVPLVAAEDVPKPGLLYRFKSLVQP